MDTATNAAPSSKPMAKPSCHRCAVRKVKCDRQQPCGACVRQKTECEYRILPPTQPKRKRGREEILLERLAQYERLLPRKDVDRDASSPHTFPKEQIGKIPPGATDSPTSSLTANRSGPTIKDTSPLRVADSTAAHSLGIVYKAQLLHDQDRSKYLDNALWTKVVEELGEPLDALGESSDEDSNEDGAAQDSMDFVLGLTPTSISIDSSHPPSDQVLELWHVFLENVDPLTKVVHAPSLQSAIHKVIVDLSSVPKSLEAILFAVYSAAVVSLKNHDCKRRWGESRKALLSRYRSATKAALTRAKLMGSANLAVLQAFLIHLLSMQEVYDSRTLWTLTGVALRIAEGMGLHRDGAFLGLPPFETEIRRRIWWQLKILNGDTAELSGSDKFGTIDSDPRNPKLPSNLNDDELHPGLSSLPPARDKATDMIFCALRYDLRSYWMMKALERRQHGKDDSFLPSFVSSADISARDKDIDEFEQILETRYVRYCDPSQPIQLMATIVARAAVNTTRLIAHHPRRLGIEEQIPESERRYIWELSIKTLKQYNMIHSSHELQRFSWHSAFFFRWPAFIHILDTIRANPLVQEADQVWYLIKEVYETHPDFLTNTKKALYVAVGNLCLKAYNAREVALANEGRPIPATPPYIKTFREQREAAAARRRNQETAVTNAVSPIKSHPVATASMPTDKQFTSQPTRSNQEQSIQLPQPRQTWLSQVTGPHQPELSGSSGAYWLSDQSDKHSDALFTFTEHDANMDLDILLAVDPSSEGPGNQTLDWVKWDALLSDFS